MKTRFTEEQIIKVLNEAEAGGKVEELCRQYGISHGTFYNWKTKFGGMTVSEVKKFRALEQENTRLKKIVADQALDLQVLKDVVNRKL